VINLQTHSRYPRRMGAAREESILSVPLVLFGGSRAGLIEESRCHPEGGSREPLEPSSSVILGSKISSTHRGGQYIGRVLASDLPLRTLVDGRNPALPTPPSGLAGHRCYALSVSSSAGPFRPSPGKAYDLIS